MSVFSITAAAGQFSSAGQINLDRLRAGVTLLATLTGYTSGSYKVQVSNDPKATQFEDSISIPPTDPRYPTNWVDHDGLTGLTASKAAILLYMAQWVRIDATALSGGTVTLGISQASPTKRQVADLWQG